MDDTERVLSRFFALKGITFRTDVPAWLREQLLMGYQVELEHGSRLDTRLNISRDAVPVTIKIALAHLVEAPDYYTRLKEMERQAKAHWGDRKDEFNELSKELNTVIEVAKN